MYDAAGNRLSKSDVIATVKYSYSEANQLLQAGDFTYGHDGNRITRQDKDYEKKDTLPVGPFPNIWIGQGWNLHHCGEKPGLGESERKLFHEKRRQWRENAQINVVDEVAEGEKKYLV